MILHCIVVQVTDCRGVFITPVVVFLQAGIQVGQGFFDDVVECRKILRDGAQLFEVTNAGNNILGNETVIRTAAEPKVSADLGGVTTVTASQAEAGTGYYKKRIPGSAVQPEMGKITVKTAYPSGAAGAGSKSDMPVWGAVYWQYFENLDRITPASTPLKLSKQVMVERLTDTGPVLEPVTEGMQLKVGDKLKVRLEITTDRNMEYVHVKDMRASALEPVNVLSGYRWQGSLGYYESTRDASTSFFINFLPKGTHVMEYALFISHAGIFSNGISTIQCMYAPEFTSHSEGVRIMVE